MQPSRPKPRLFEKLTENPSQIVVVTERIDLGRALVHSIADPGFRFVVVPRDDLWKLPGGLSTFDLVLLQVGREKADGALLQEILHAGVGGVVVLTGATSGVERALWLDRGADDCVSQPCDGNELLARLRASIRRRSRRLSEPPPTLRVGALMVSLGERRAEIGGRPLELTTCEFSLLAALAENAGQVLGRERLMEIVRGSADVAFERSIDVQVSRLRAKMKDNSRQPQILKTVRGVGYMLVSCSACFR